MKIILVATGAKGRNVVFVDNALNVYPLEEAVRLAKAGKLENVYVVQKGSGVYLRTSRNVPRKNQLEHVAVSAQQLHIATSGLRHAPSIPPALTRYLELYERSLEEKGGPFIASGGRLRILTQAVKEKLTTHRDSIFDAARRFDVDPHLLGAILIDEIAQFTPFEDVLAELAVFFVGRNASAGIAQVKVETARGLIQNGYYNPNPSDPKLSPQRIKNASRAHLYRYIKEPKHSIFFASARMRALTDEWKKFVDLSYRPEIIATLYHLPYKPPHRNPEANPRGLQISSEFYQFAKAWLR